MAEVEEDHALFLVHGFLDLDLEESRGKVQASSFHAKNTEFNVEEPQAHAFLDTNSDG